MNKIKLDYKNQGYILKICEEKLFIDRWTMKEIVDKYNDIEDTLQKYDSPGGNYMPDA